MLAKANTVILETERLLLRLQSATDVDFLVRLWTDPRMTAYLGGPRDRAAMQREFESVAAQPDKDEFDLWPLVRKADNCPVGYAGFIPKTVLDEDCIELNYFLDPAYWGQGYATEIAAALLDYGFTVKRLERLVSLINPDNTASERVAVKIGLRFVQNLDRSGHPRRLYALHRDEYAATFRQSGSGT